MSFKFVGYCKKVFRYDIISDFIINSTISETDSNQGLLFLVSPDNLELVTERIAMDYFSSLIVQNNRILAIDSKGHGFLLNYSLDIIVEIPISLKIALTHSFLDYLPVYRGRIKERVYGIFSLITNTLIWESGTLKGFELFGDHLFAQSDFILYYIEVTSGSLKWEFDFNKKFKIPGRIILMGVNSNIIYCGIEPSEVIIALEITTGKLIWEIKAFPQLYRLGPNGDYLYAISSGYTKIEAKTGQEVDSYTNREYFEEVGIFSQRGNYAITNNHIITTDSNKGVIGAFNTLSHQFDWIHREEGVSFPAPNPIIYKKPYLLLQDNKSSLHIFKEDLPIVS